MGFSDFVKGAARFAQDKVEKSMADYDKKKVRLEHQSDRDVLRSAVKGSSLNEKLAAQKVLKERGYTTQSDIRMLNDQYHIVKHLDK